MANDISARPWKIDTPGAGVIFQAQVYIKYVYWFNPIAPADLATITDRNAKNVLPMRAEVANQSQTFNIENWFEGLIVPTLASGVLYIHIR